MTHHVAYGRDAHGDKAEFGDTPRSVSYRYGYQVGAAPARYVGATTDRDKAVNLARQKATEVRALLADIGAASEVTWWIQPRVRLLSVEFGAPESGTD